MRVRNLTFGVKDLRIILDETREAMERIAAGQKVEKVHDVNFTNYQALRNILTPRRLALLHVIKERSPGSVDELAQLLRRDLKTINDDLALLATIGLVELRQTTRSRKKIVPCVTVDRIQVEIAV